VPWLLLLEGFHTIVTSTKAERISSYAWQSTESHEPSRYNARLRPYRMQIAALVVVLTVKIVVMVEPVKESWVATALHQ
jgi:hypothetical protein